MSLLGHIWYEPIINPLIEKILTLPLDEYHDKYMSLKTKKTMGKYGERVHYCRLMHLHIVASLKTLHEKLQENSSRKKEYNICLQDIVTFWIKL